MLSLETSDKIGTIQICNGTPEVNFRSYLITFSGRVIRVIHSLSKGNP